MSRRSPFVIVLSEADRVELVRRAASYSAPHAVVVRARIVLLAADGLRNMVIAARLGVCVDVVTKWRRRFCDNGIAALADRKRAGRPRVFPAPVVAEVKAMACEPPTSRGAPLSRWSSAELAAQAVADGVVESVSTSTVRRWLGEDSIKPWRHRSWIFPRDPDFAVKAGRILDLYQRSWAGHRLGPDEYVISADEKCKLQALARCHPGLAAAPGRVARVEFEYERGGTRNPDTDVTPGSTTRQDLQRQVDALRGVGVAAHELVTGVWRGLVFENLDLEPEQSIIVPTRSMCSSSCTAPSAGRTFLPSSRRA